MVHCGIFILNLVASFQAFDLSDNWTIINILILLVKFVDLNVLNNIGLKVRFYGLLRRHMDVSLLWDTAL